MKPLFSQKFAILTADNPRYGSAEGGNAALEQEMKAKNLKFTPMKGKYGVPENSYLVENPDHQDILSWGKKYGQDSVIVSDNGLHKMVYTNGLHEGLWHEGHSVSIHDKEPEDFYSTINLNNKPTHFTIDFDMNTKHGESFKKSKNNDTKSSEPIKLYHITDKARFKLNPKFAPEDNASAIHSRAGRTGIYLSPNPETWINNQGFNFASGYHRPFVVEFHVDPSLLQDKEVGGRWGDEKFIPSHLFHKLSINRIIPTDAYIREKHGTVGDFEEFSEKTFDTAEPLSSVIGPKPPWGWSSGYPFKGYKYPHDVRSLPDEEIKKLKENFYNTRKQIQKKEKARQRLNERLKSKRPKEKFNFEKSLKKSDSAKHLIHFSTTPSLTTLDPEFQGTAGRHSPETKHGKPTHPRVYFYEEGTPTESVVTSGAKSKYVVKHPGHDKIIDIANDLENQQQAKQQWMQKPIGSMQDAYFKLLKDKGYLGFKNSASSLPNVVAMFHATPVHAEIPMPKDMAANPDWTKAEIPMSLKKSDVKEAVEKIKGPAKVSEVLSEAKPDMRSKILAALRKEKLAKMNGTGIPGAGGATPPMMRPPVPAAPASMAMSKADESESRMAKKDLKDIMEYAQALDKMVVESEDLEDWVDSKITVARQYLSDIAHYLSYEHGKPTEELDKGDVISMKDKKVISTDTKPAPKELVTQQPKKPKIKRSPVLIQTVNLAKSEDLEKGDVVSMKDRKVISTDTKAAPKKLVAQQPTTAKEEREGQKHPLRDSWKMAHTMSKEAHKEASEYHSALGDKFDGQSSKHGNYNWQDDQEKRDYHWNQANVHDFMANGDNFMAAEYLKELKKYRNPYEHGSENSPKKTSRPELAKSEDLEKGDVVSMKDRKVISTDTKAAPKTLIAKQPKAAAEERIGNFIKVVSANANPASQESVTRKPRLLTVSREGGGIPVYAKTHPIHDSLPGVHAEYDFSNPKHQDILRQAIKLAASKGHGIVYVKPSQKKPEAPSLGLAKSDSKKAKFERCVLAVKKKSGDKVNPWAVCHASVDGAKKSEDLEKADMKVKEQAKPTKGMPQAKQLKADADLEKIKEGAENVAKAADKKKSELNKSGYFKEDKKTQLPKWHDPLQEQRESAAQEEQELRPESKMHIWAELERQKQMSQKPKKPKEELEKGKNVRKQREAVFGGWKTSAGSPRREKQIAALTDMIKRRFGLEAKRAPGKVAASGKVIDKPNFHDNVVEHIGNPDSLVHEVGHLYQYGKDMESIDPRKEFKTKEQSLSDWQKDMDTHWGDINVKHGYKKQAQTAEEYEPTALENYYRRRAGLPTHQKTASTEEENRIESEKRGKKYKKPEIPRTQAVDDPSKEIVQKVKVKGKDGQEKEVWLTGSMKNLTNKTRELVDQIDRGELMLDPTRGFVEGTSVDAKINRRARAASQDKTRKDADTLMRSDEVLEKKLIPGEGKPSKATKKATTEEHKAIMDKLSTALDTVKVDMSPEAVKERKMLLEHVKHKLKGQK